MSGDQLPPLLDDLDLYFDLSGPHALVPVTMLQPLKDPTSQPESVGNAEALMRQAARGEIEKRGPLCVKPLQGAKFQVLDGNATYGVAARSGFALLPVIVCDHS